MYYFGLIMVFDISTKEDPEGDVFGFHIIGRFTEGYQHAKFQIHTISES